MQPNVCLQASDGSNSRDDLPAQILRRNDQIRKLEAKLSGRQSQVNGLDWCIGVFIVNHWFQVLSTQAVDQSGELL